MVVIYYELKRRFLSEEETEHRRILRIQGRGMHIPKLVSQGGSQ
jgi:hypothetical protein